MTTRRSILTAAAGSFLVAGLSACQTAHVAAPVPLPVNGVGYVLLNAPINERTARLLIDEFARLINAGAQNIQVAMNSPGGELGPAEWIVNSMKSAHDSRRVSFQAYNVGQVSSAASYVFLNAQQRFSRQGGVFLFHAAGLVSTGLVSAQRLREAADRITGYENLMRETMRTRTRLTASEREVYLSRTVLLSADDAKRDGVIDEIATFTPPPGKGIYAIAAAPANRAAAAPATQPN